MSILIFNWTCNEEIGQLKLIDSWCICNAICCPNWQRL